LGQDSPCEQVGAGAIEFVPYERDRRRLALYYQAADLFVHAARAESFCNVVSEARACGLPVVAGAVGGIAEQIDSGRDGVLTPPEDSAAMAHAIVELLQDSARRRGLAAAGAKTVAQRFTVAGEVAAYLDWFASVLEERRGRRAA
jgi:glycosyltransferase involved in cell wall biosynthesis